MPRRKFGRRWPTAELDAMAREEMTRKIQEKAETGNNEAEDNEWLISAEGGIPQRIALPKKVDLHAL